MFCSGRCKTRSVRAKQVKISKIDTCLCCGNSYLKVTNKMFCSPKCQEEASNIRRNESGVRRVGRVERICAYVNCDISFITTEKSGKNFCCAEHSRLEKKRLNGEPVYIGSPQSCAYCEMTFIPKRLSHKFCSVPCREDARKERVGEWTYNPEYHSKYYLTVGKFLRHPHIAYKKDSCEKCGFLAEHSCQLDVDHIDGNKKNNDPYNLQTLCANCHRLKTYENRDWDRRNKKNYKKVCNMS